MESMEQGLVQTVAVWKQGDLTCGRIVSVNADGAFVDISSKSEGYIARAELTLSGAVNADEVVKVGDEVYVVVLNPDAEGMVLLSKVQADALVAWDKLQQSIDTGAQVEVKVLALVKGGLAVDVFGIRGFMPASQTDLQRVEDLGSFVGTNIHVKVIELEIDRKRVIVSRRKVLEEQRAEREAQIYKEIAVGQRLTGTVSRLTGFGAFVEVAGIEGLIHISDLAWQRVKDPAEVVQIGDAVEVVVLKVDAGAKRLSLSLRDTLPDPWIVAAANLAENTIVNGRVTKLAPFGAFIAILPGVEGLVHVSEIADQHIKRPEEVLAIGQEVLVKILEIDRGQKRLSLSIKQAAEQQERDEFKDYLQEKESFGMTIGDKFADLAKLFK